MTLIYGGELGGGQGKGGVLCAQGAGTLVVCWLSDADSSKGGCLGNFWKCWWETCWLQVRGSCVVGEGWVGGRGGVGSLCAGGGDSGGVLADVLKSGCLGSCWRL